MVQLHRWCGDSEDVAEVRPGSRPRLRTPELFDGGHTHARPAAVCAIAAQALKHLVKHNNLRRRRAARQAAQSTDTGAGASDTKEAELSDASPQQVPSSPSSAGGDSSTGSRGGRALANSREASSSSNGSTPAASKSATGHSKPAALVAHKANLNLPQLTTASSKARAIPAFLARLQQIAAGRSPSPLASSLPPTPRSPSPASPFKHTPAASGAAAVAAPATAEGQGAAAGATANEGGDREDNGGGGDVDSGDSGDSGDSSDSSDSDTDSDGDGGTGLNTSKGGTALPPRVPPLSQPQPVPAFIAKLQEKLRKRRDANASQAQAAAPTSTATPATAAVTVSVAPYPSPTAPSGVNASSGSATAGVRAGACGTLTGTSRRQASPAASSNSSPRAGSRTPRARRRPRRRATDSAASVVEILPRGPFDVHLPAVMPSPTFMSGSPFSHGSSPGSADSSSPRPRKRPRRRQGPLARAPLLHPSELSPRQSRVHRREQVSESTTARHPPPLVIEDDV